MVLVCVHTGDRVVLRPLPWLEKARDPVYCFHGFLEHFPLPFGRCFRLCHLKQQNDAPCDQIRVFKHSTAEQIDTVDNHQCP